MGRSKRGMTILLSLAVMVIAVVLAVGGTAYAVSGYLNTFNSTYGTAGTRLDTCVLCHPSGTGGARNSFGSDFASGGHNFNAALEALDSDGDGILNGAEIAALTFPGDPNDPPSAGAPNISVPASVNLGEVVVNGNSSREVAIANTGDAVLNVSSIALNAGTDFTLDLNGGANPCGTANPAIAAAGNCTVAVVFAPTSVGAFGDSLAIASDDPDQPDVSVALSGTGLDNVTPVVTSATDNGTITLDTSGNAGTSFGGVTALQDTDASLNQTGKPAGVAFPYGLVSFTVDNVAVGGTITVDVTFPAAIPAGATYYKVGATGFVEYTDVVFNGNTATLTLTDGGSGDLDGAADGSISDPGGLAVPVSQSSSSSGGGGSCSVIGSGGNGGGGAVLFLTLLAILVALRLRRHMAKAGR
ncbi:MAG: choice-of-anchor U domain-containing protein [Candidatus Deferrimicrobiaceae bacterium]